MEVLKKDDIKEFLEELKEQSLFLTEKNGDILLKGLKGKLTKDEVAKIKADNRILSFIKGNKEEILKFLSENKSNEPKQDKKTKKKQVSFYPLSPLQQGMLFHNLYENDAKAYIEQLDADIIGEVNIQALKQAWELVLKNHSALRTGFVYDQLNVPLQYAHADVELPFEVLDFSDLSSADRAIKFNSFLKNDIDKGFDLSKPPLMRVSVIKMEEGLHKLVWTHHHILIDGWSLATLFGEIIEDYELLSKSKAPKNRVEDLYEDFIKYLNKIDKYSEEYFWTDYLKGFEETTLLPFSNDNIDRNKGGDAKELNLNFDPTFTDKVNHFTKTQHFTTNTLIQGVWAFLLSTYTGKKDVVYGVTVSGRPDDMDKAEQKIGLYINTLPLRATLKDDQKITDWFLKLQTENVTLREHQYTAINDIQSWTSLSGGDFFDSIIVFENYPVDEVVKQESLLNIDNVSGSEQSNYLLTIKVALSDTLNINFSYNDELITLEQVEMIKLHFERLIHQIVEGKDLRVANLKVLSKKDTQELLHDFNPPQKAIKKQTLVSVFEKQVEKTPNKIALEFEDKHLTFSEINSKANKLANYLKANYSINAEDAVGLKIERGEWMIISMLAILKAGGAYVPIDPTFPEERLDWMVEDSACKLLLDQQELDKFQAVENQIDEANLTEKPVSKNLAYIIYTSGSSGKPKGVQIAHGTIVNKLEQLAKFWDLSEEERILQTGNYVFDLSIEQIFSALLRGGTLVMISKDNLLDNKEVERVLDEKAITHLHATPSFISALEAKAYKTLKLVISGGETCPYQLAASWSNYVRFYNMYGPTEASIISCGYLFDANDKELPNSLPIGKPLDNTKVYILDNHLNLVPKGVAGELFISGSGLARGYNNLEAVTKEKFIQSPFGEDEIMYRTGDMVQWLPSGNLKFIGRKDYQVKIRGHRIELGEIETVLNNAPDVSQSLVLVKEDSDDVKRLVAFVVVEDTFDLDVIKGHMKNMLPGYMIPSLVINLESFPLTSNGKIDRKSLLTHPRLADSTTILIKPKNETERKLLEIWTAALKRQSISMDADLFELGSHSLLVMKVRNIISKAFNIKIAIKELFEHTTISSLAVLIDQKEEGSYEMISPAPVMDHYPLSHAQKGLWLIDTMNKNQTSYNVPKLEEVDGHLDPAVLKECLVAVMERHEILRTVFKSIDGTPRQIVLDTDGMADFFFFSDFSTEEDALNKGWALVNKKANIVFDLEQGPLMQVDLVKTGADKYLLLVNMHHIISDEWSSSIFYGELLGRYYASIKGLEYKEEPLAIQYKDYAWWQTQNVEQGNYAKSKEFWMEYLSGELPRFTLPQDFARPSVKTYAGDRAHLFIENKIITDVEAVGKSQKATLYMTLLAALKTLFYRYTGQDDIIIGGPIAGRAKEEFSDQLGYYANTLAIRTQFSGDHSFNELLNIVKDNLTQVYDNQYYPFDLLVSDLNIVNDPGRSALFDVSFTFQNIDSNQEEMSSKFEQVTAPVAENGKTESNEAEATNDNVTLAGSKFDMSFVMQRTEDGLNVYINYNTDIYKDERVVQLLENFERLLQDIASKQEQKLSEVSFLGAAQLKMLQSFNETKNEKETLSSIQAYFERNAELHPDRPAVIIGEQSLTYSEVNKKANQLAHWLQKEHQVGQGQFVAHMIKHHEYQLIATLGILKAGAAFVPLDPFYPVERIKFILQDAKPVITLSNKDLDEALTASDEHTFVNINDILEDLESQAEDNIDLGNCHDQLAYVIYTSGSTGNPKGVMLEHKGNINMVTDQVRRFELNENDRFLQFASISFDASVYETFIALYAGIPLVLLPENLIENPDNFIDYIETNQVTVVTLPPVYLNSLNKERLGFLRLVITAGEAPILSDCLQLSQSLDYFNAFGPTEFSVCTNVYKIKGDEKVIPIGKPLDNTQIYILDSHLNQVPIGCWGEIYMAGAGMARGYINQPELTSQVFMDNIFDSGTRMYKSGDVGRWLSSGEVEFYGRNDSMVKIRGYRVELPEIERVLMNHPQIEQAVVHYRRESTNKDFLFAYLVSDEQWDKEEIIAYIKAYLPFYMIPTHFIGIDHIPLTTSGKVDYKSLPLPKEGANKRINRAANNALEEELLEMWKELLEEDDVGFEDPFFEIGGNSMLAMMLVAQIWDKYKFDVTMADFMENQTIGELALLFNKIKSNRGLVLPLSKAYDDQQSIFMIPPVLGSSIIYYPLVSLLEESDLNCYGLQYKGFDDGKTPDNNIEEMAMSFFNEIQKILEPGGEPIIIFGYSMGGILAFELVKILEQNDYECKLIILDKATPSTDGEHEPATEDNLEELYNLNLKNVKEEIPHEDKDRLIEFLLHNITVHGQYRISGGVLADTLAIESAIPELTNNMKEWASYTEGAFIHEGIEADHFSVLDDEHLSVLKSMITNFITE